MPSAVKNTPSVQGWWSKNHNHKEPGSAARFSSSIPDSAIIAWVALPAKGTVPEVRARRLPSPQGTIRILVEREHRPADELAICMDAPGPVQLTGNHRPEGRMAWLRSGEEAQAAGGRVLDEYGTVVRRHAFTPDVPLRKEGPRLKE